METMTLKGHIVISPPNITNKHIEQSDWKRTAMVMLGGDISEYFAWFIKKRYSLKLTKPLREPHITFINDKLSDFSIPDVDLGMNLLKDKYDGLETEITINLDPRTNVKHWWLNVTEESREFLHDIRKEVGLERPFSGLHLTIGRVNDCDLEHSDYIRRSIILLGQ